MIWVNTGAVVLARGVISRINALKRVYLLRIGIIYALLALLLPLRDVWTLVQRIMIHHKLMTTGAVSIIAALTITQTLIAPTMLTGIINGARRSMLVSLNEVDPFSE